MTFEPYKINHRTTSLFLLFHTWAGIQVNTQPKPHHAWCTVSNDHFQYLWRVWIPNFALTPSFYLPTERKNVSCTSNRTNIEFHVNLFRLLKLQIKSQAQDYDQRWAVCRIIKTRSYRIDNNWEDTNRNIYFLNYLFIYLFIHTGRQREAKAVVFQGASSKFRQATISFAMSVRPSVRPSVCPHGTTRLPLDGFWLNLIFGVFSKICRENSSFIQIRQE